MGAGTKSQTGFNCLWVLLLLLCIRLKPRWGPIIALTYELATSIAWSEGCGSAEVRKVGEQLAIFKFLHNLSATSETIAVQRGKGAAESHIDRS